MNFKIGDIVYCINRNYTINKSTSSLLTYIQFDIPYEIKNISKNYIYIKSYSHSLQIERFISKNDYITMNRKNKIENIRKNIKNGIKTYS